MMTNDSDCDETIIEEESSLHMHAESPTVLLVQCSAFVIVNSASSR